MQPNAPASQAISDGSKKKLIQHLKTHIHTFTRETSRCSPYSKREGSRGLSGARRWKISTILEEEEGEQSILSSAIRQRC